MATKEKKPKAAKGEKKPKAAKGEKKPKAAKGENPKGKIVSELKEQGIELHVEGEYRQC